MCLAYVVYPRVKFECRASCCAVAEVSAVLGGEDLKVTAAVGGLSAVIEAVFVAVVTACIDFQHIAVRY